MKVMTSCGVLCANGIVTSTTMATTCIAMAIDHPVESRARGPRSRSNSGEHLSQTVGALEQARRGGRERDPEEPFGPRSERRPGERHHAHVLERAALECGGGQPFGQRQPEIHRGLRRLTLESLRGERG